MKLPIPLKLLTFGYHFKIYYHSSKKDSRNLFIGSYHLGSLTLITKSIRGMP